MMNDRERASDTLQRSRFKRYDDRPAVSTPDRYACSLLSQSSKSAPTSACLRPNATVACR